MQSPSGREGESGREEEKSKMRSNQEAPEVAPMMGPGSGNRSGWTPSSYRGDSIGFPGRDDMRKGGERPGAEVGLEAGVNVAIS